MAIEILTKIKIKMLLTMITTMDLLRIMMMITTLRIMIMITTLRMMNGSIMLIIKGHLLHFVVVV